MSFGDVIGSVIGSIGSYLGGREASKEANDQQLFNYQAQKEFAQSGIRWKVEDAKAAGLHPLFALGGSGAAFSPGPIVTPQGEALVRSGQELGRAASAAMSTVERAMIAAKLEESRAAARRDDAEGAYMESLAARTRQAGPGIDLDPGTTWSVAGDPAGVQLSSLRSAQDVMGMPLPPEAPPTWITGEPVKSAWDRYQVGPGLQMLLPAGSSMSEALESVSESTILGGSIIAMNAKHYGRGWIDRLALHMGWPASKAESLREKLDAWEMKFLRPRLSPSAVGDFMFPE